MSCDLDEPSAGRKFAADLFEHKITAPGLVGKIERERNRIVIAGRAGETSLVIKIGLEDLVAEKIRIAVLEIDARNRVFSENRWDRRRSR